jgi:hypothetical protein
MTTSLLLFNFFGTAHLAQMAAESNAPPNDQDQSTATASLTEQSQGTTSLLLLPPPPQGITRPDMDVLAATQTEHAANDGDDGATTGTNDLQQQQQTQVPQTRQTIVHFSAILPNYDKREMKAAVADKFEEKLKSLTTSASIISAAKRLAYPAIRAAHALELALSDRCAWDDDSHSE